MLVLDDSASGNTAKMAVLVAQEAESIPGIEVCPRKVGEFADDGLWCDGLALGSPINMGLLSWRLKRFWDETMTPHQAPALSQDAQIVNPGVLLVLQADLEPVQIIPRLEVVAFLHLVVVHCCSWHVLTAASDNHTA